MIFSSAEIRWFIKGEIPQQIREWFNDFDNAPVQQAMRTDYYLALPGTEAMGIQMREGRLEFKQRIDNENERLEMGNCHGKIECWQKWSFGLDDIPAGLKSIISYPESWRGISKERSLHMFILPESGIPEVHHHDVALENACILELTKVGVQDTGEKWWSVGFEAFGELQNLRSTLLSVLKYTMLNPNALEMKLDDSYGYPAWILKSCHDVNESV